MGVAGGYAPDSRSILALGSALGLELDKEEIGRSSGLLGRAGSAFRSAAETNRAIVWVGLSKIGHYPMDNVLYHRLSDWKNAVKEKARCGGLGPEFRGARRSGTATKLRGEFEDHAGTAGAAGSGGAIKISLIVEDEVGVGLGAVGAGESMQNRVFPFAGCGGCQLINHSAVAAGTAVDCSAIEVAGFVHDYPGSGLEAGGASLEAVQYGLFPAAVGAGREPEHDSPATTAARCCAIEVAAAVHEQRSPSGRMTVLVVDREAVQHLFLPAGRSGHKLVYRTVHFVRSAGIRCAIQVAGCIQNQTGKRGVPVGAVGVRAKRVKHGLVPATSTRREFEDRAPVIGAAVRPCAVQVPGLVHYQASRRFAAVAALRPELINGELRPAARTMRELEDCAIVMGAAEVRGSVPVAETVLDQAAVGLAPVRVTVAEAVQCGFGPGAVSTACELEDYAISVRATAAGCPIEVTFFVEAHAGPQSAAVRPRPEGMQHLVLRSSPSGLCQDQAYRNCRQKSSTTPCQRFIPHGTSWGSFG